MKTARTSARIFLCQRKDGELRFFLVHPGGPFFAKKDDGAWSIPGGELDAGEVPLTAA